MLTMNLEYSYCRLCAESKPNNKQIHLRLDDVKKSEIIERLARVNAAIDFNEYSLPKAVCFECIYALNRAYDFVVAIECAQSALNQIFEVPIVKKEKLESDEEEKQENAQSDEELQESLHEPHNLMKKESDVEEIDRESHGTNQDSDSEHETPKPKTKEYKNKSSLDIDSIPLSQLSQLKLSWRNYSWYCTFCETLFTSIIELKKHSMECHKVCNPYRCTDCKIRKIRLDSFLIHVQRHHKNLRYSCYKCFEQFKTAAAARKHKATHLNTKFICIGCNTPFANNEELEKHMEEFCRSKWARPLPTVLQMDGLTCKICQKSFKSKSGLNTHVMIHTERKKEHTCEVCGKGFFLKYNLASHLIMHKDERPHKCQICNYAFKTARLLKNHVGVHNNAKPYACTKCGRCFRLLKQLNSHSIIHTDIHPYSCPHCQKQFRFKSILNSHIRLHTGVKPYSCEPCQRDFSNWSNYNKHMKRKHNTDKAKKKHTPDGLYPVDPNTGNVIVTPETNKIIEWKNKILLNRGQGRPPKTKEPSENGESSTTLSNLS